MDTITQFWHGLMSGTLPPLGYWTYLLLALLVAVEGPAATLLGGMMAASGALNPVAVFLVAGTGNFTADASWYVIGRWGHFDYVMERFPRTRKWRPQINFLQLKLHRHATKMLIFTKLSMGIASIPTLIAAGMARIKWRQLAPISVLGEVIWSGGLVLCGYYFGQYVAQLEQGLKFIAIGGFVVCGFFVLYFYKQLMAYVSKHANMAATTDEEEIQ